MKNQFLRICFPKNSTEYRSISKFFFAHQLRLVTPYYKPKSRLTMHHRPNKFIINDKPRDYEGQVAAISKVSEVYTSRDKGTDEKTLLSNS